jgi:hypothetical protein
VGDASAAGGVAEVVGGGGARTFGLFGLEAEAATEGSFDLFAPGLVVAVRGGIQLGVG